MTRALDRLTSKAASLLESTYKRYDRVAIVASFQAESGVLIDLASRLVAEPEVLTIDTGRLPDATQQVIDQFRRRYPIRLRVLAPALEEVQTMTARHGPALFRDSVELRMLCCEIRKVRPLAKALTDYDAWITGIRREQTPSRAKIRAMELDPAHDGIIKIAPLAVWSGEQVWRYLELHQVPVHPLYAHGYTSIGCEPCTRPTEPGEDARAGRWWWERDGLKECGLHQAPKRRGAEEEVAAARPDR